MHFVMIVILLGKRFNEHGKRLVYRNQTFLLKNDCFSPKCRVKVTGKKRNVVINGILEAFLKAYPHKRPAPKDDDQDKPVAKKAAVC